MKVYAKMELAYAELDLKDSIVSNLLKLYRQDFLFGHLFFYFYYFYQSLLLVEQHIIMFTLKIEIDQVFDSQLNNDVQ